MTRPLLVVGDVLLDRDVEGAVRRVCPDAPAPVLEDVVERERPGGAGLAALLAALDGREVVLLTALGDDTAGRRARQLLEPHVRVLAVPDLDRTREKERLRSGGTSLARVDRGGPGRPDGDALPEDLQDLLDGSGAVLVADYGGGMAALPAVRAALAGTSVPVVWDPHPRGAVPVPGVTLVTPNEAEAAGVAGTGPEGPDGEPLRGYALADQRARSLVARWHAKGVAVTLGSRGALLSFGDGAPFLVPAPAVQALDTCGAGDRFATAAAGALADGALPTEAVEVAVHTAAAFVAAGGGGAVPVGAADVPASSAAAEADNRPAGREPLADALAVVRRVRAAGGTVVATGGCFDLLHAGHVETLAAARRLGDCLVVCLNSDASVRRLKGAARPLNPEGDRAQVLAALACVDAVAVFDEDTPVEVLSTLRPDVWAKGGDYAGATLPEAELLHSWGGQTVVLPYLDGRSTTRLVATAAGRSTDTTAGG